MIPHQPAAALTLTLRRIAFLAFVSRRDTSPQLQSTIFAIARFV